MGETGEVSYFIFPATGILNTVHNISLLLGCLKNCLKVYMKMHYSFYCFQVFSLAHNFHIPNENVGSCQLLCSANMHWNTNDYF